MNNHIHEFNFDKINEFIYAGNNQCCRQDLDVLLVQDGVTIDVSLEEDQLDAPVGVNMYTWIPIIDHDVPNEFQIQLFIRTISEAVSLGLKTYIHCRNGHGRTGTMLVLYFMETEKLNFTDAFHFVKSKRPSVHLSEKQLTFLENR